MSDDTSYHRLRKTARWQKLRLRVLNRANWRCHYCGGQANQVDHVIALVDGGAMFDERNLVAACGPCNLAKRSPRWVPKLASPIRQVPSRMVQRDSIFGKRVLSSGVAGPSGPLAPPSPRSSRTGPPASTFPRDTSPWSVVTRDYSRKAADDGAA